MVKITGTEKEIKHIKSVLYCSSDCPLCENPGNSCLRGSGGCNDIDTFYECIESNIVFDVSN